MGESAPLPGVPAASAMTLSRAWLWLLVACLAWSLAAQAAPAPVDVRFLTWSTEAGLSQVSASDLLEDRHGFLWIATQDGLNRFDGYRFEVWRHRAGDPASLGDNYVLALAEDRDGGIWAATQNGLNRLDPASDRIERFDSERGGLRDNLVIAIHASANGQVYASTRRGGIQRFNSANRSFESLPALPTAANRQRVLYLHPDGRLVVVQDEELWELDADGQRIRVLLAGLLPPGAIVQVALPLADGGLAIGSNNQGLLLFDAQGAVARWLRKDSGGGGLPDDSVRSLHQDSAGRLWVGTAQGLARMEPDGRVSVWRHRPGDRSALPGDRVVSLLQDRRGLLWIGTWTGGLARFDPETEHIRVQRHGDPEPWGLGTNAVNALSAAANGGVWIGQVDRGGAAQLDRHGRVLRRLAEDGPEPRLSSGDVTAILAADGGVWVGYLRGGLDWFGSGGSVRRIPTGIGARALPANGVQGLRLDRDGTLWLGLLSGGVFSLCRNCDELRSWPLDPSGTRGPLGTSVNDIYQSADGRLWFAVRRAGLSWYDPQRQRWGALTRKGPAALALPHDSVTSVMEDAGGKLWIGTQGGGISRIERDPAGEPTAVRSFSEEAGLASSMVGAILDGGDGRLWVSTTRGLCIFHGEQARFECLGDRDPLLAADFFVASAARDTDGGLHFGGSQGLVSIAEPARVAFRHQPAEVVLTELRIANRRMLPGDADSPLAQAIEHSTHLSLRHDQDMVAIEFAALDLRRAAALRYRYRLLGRDNDWIDTDASRRVATYTGLPSARYQFEVEAWDGAERVGTRTLAVEVLPAPWLGPWARLGYALLLFGAIALLAWRYRWRTHERERTQDALAQSEAMLKYALWGSRGELWDADLRSGKLSRRNRLEHLDVTRKAKADTLEAYTPFVHPDDQAHFRDQLAACLKGSSDLFECSYRSPDVDGQWRWLLSRGRVFSRDAQGRAMRMVGTTFDITELRANEEAARASRDRLNLALWGSGDEMWDIDLTSGRIRRENPLPSIRLSTDVLVPKLADYMSHVHPADQARLRESLLAHLKGAVDHFECSYRTIGADGGWVWLLGKGRVLVRDSKGLALRMVGTNRDITQLKQVEEDLRSLNEELETRVVTRTEALERANADLKRTLDQLVRAQRQLVESEKLAALGGLVAGVAHEINTPLGVGVTAASHLQHETERLARLVADSKVTRNELDHYIDQARQSSDLVLRNLERASQLVRSFKQVAVDQSSEQRRVFKLREYLSEVLMSLHPRVKKQRTEVEILGNEDLVMDTYPGALYQILVNLVINSLVHAFDEQPGGRIEIEVGADGDEAVIDYRDNGKGMGESVRKRVFEPFFTTRRGSGGSGLGLHIVYNLATQVLCGSVSCDSTPGRGTHFRLRLPRIAPGRAAAQPDGGG
jgi:signal transduction histidine kinase/ligand-binding sensor domain-containing protein